MKAKELKLKNRFSRGDKDQKENHGSLAREKEEKEETDADRETDKKMYEEGK